MSTDWLEHGRKLPVGYLLKVFKDALENKSSDRTDAHVEAVRRIIDLLNVVSAQRKEIERLKEEADE